MQGGGQGERSRASAAGNAIFNRPLYGVIIIYAGRHIVKGHARGCLLADLGESRFNSHFAARHFEGKLVVRFLGQAKFVAVFVGNNQGV